MVTALLSRLRHQCTTIRIDGPSLRELQGRPRTSRAKPAPTAGGAALTLTGGPPVRPPRVVQVS
jgi:hypothetical protein